MSKKKKKVMVYKMPKAQDGMQMAEGAPQEQGGGQDQMQQLAMQVQQMLEQGADPAQVVAQLVQGGVPPQAVAQILVSLGMPEEQVMPMIEQVMQQMQGGQQQAPPQEGMAPEGQPMMQDGGEAEQQAMLEQMIMIFAAMNQAQPEQVMQALQNGELDIKQVQEAVQSPQGQEVAAQLQQMAMQQQGGSPQEQMMQQVMARGGTVPPGYHRMPDGSIMADSAHMDDGGQVDELMMGAINPTKEDFLSLKKEMLKSMKKGGTTTAFDTSDTASYVQNLQGAVANHVARNMRVGMINKKFDEVIQKFDELPKAKGGADITDQMLVDQYGLTQQALDKFKTDPAYRQQFVTEYQYDFPEYADAAVEIKEDTENKVSEESINQGTDEKTFDEQFEERMKHYFPGWGQGQTSLGGKYIQNKFDKSPIGLLAGAFGKQNTGNYDVVGFGELEGKGIKDIDAKMAEIAANPEQYGFQTTRGYVNRRGKMKKRPGLFGRPEAVQFDYIGRGTPTTNGETEDQVAEEVAEEVAVDSNAPKAAPNVPSPQASGGTYDNEIVAGVLPPGGVGTAESNEATAGEDTYRTMLEQKIADGTATRKEQRTYEKYMEESPYMSDKQAAKFEKKYDKKYGKETDIYDGLTEEEIRQVEPNQKKADRIIRKMQKKNPKTAGASYGEMLDRGDAEVALQQDPLYKIASQIPLGAFQYGGSVSQPGRMAVNFGQVRNTNHPTHALFRAFNGLETKPVELLDEKPLNKELMGYGPQGQMQPGQSGFRLSNQQERTRDYGAISQGIYEGIDSVGNFFQNVKDTPSTAQAQAELQSRVPVYDPGSGSLGFYNQFGDARFASSGQLGAPQRAGTGSDPEANRFTPGLNYQSAMGWGDGKPMFVKNGGMIMAQLGLQVGDEVELSENEILELAKYGYQISRM